MDELRAAIEAHIEVPVSNVAPLGGGACQDLFRVDLATGEALVLRSDAATRLPGSLTREQEFPVVQAARRAGVLTPAARWPARGLVHPGSTAYFLDRVEGETLGGRIVRDPKLEAARERLPRQLAEQLARIHSVTPDASLPHEDALAFQRRMLDTLPEPRPALEIAWRWLAAHRPAPTRTCLVHGDFRTGNFVVGPEGLVAVLDWEFAHRGSPEEDLAWLCLRDWRFGQLEKAAGGIAPREEFYRLYEEASGTAVDREAVRWWEVLGNVRWAAGALFQGMRSTTDLELVAIAPRAVEMEYEALLLMGVRAEPVEPAVFAEDPLLRAAGSFLRQLTADKALAWKARLAAHLVGVAEREKALGPAHERQDRAELEALLGGPGTDRDLVSRLDELPGAAATVMRRLRRRLQVVNPSFDPEAEPC